MLVCRGTSSLAEPARAAPHLEEKMSTRLETVEAEMLTHATWSVCGSVTTPILDLVRSLLLTSHSSWQHGLVPIEPVYGWQEKVY